MERETTFDGPLPHYHEANNSPISANQYECELHAPFIIISILVTTVEHIGPDRVAPAVTFVPVFLDSGFVDLDVRKIATHLLVYRIRIFLQEIMTRLLLLSHWKYTKV